MLHYLVHLLLITSFNLCFHPVMTVLHHHPSNSCFDRHIPSNSSTTATPPATVVTTVLHHHTRIPTVLHHHNLIVTSPRNRYYIPQQQLLRLLCVVMSSRNSCYDCSSPSRPPATVVRTVLYHCPWHTCCYSHIRAGTTATLEKNDVLDMHVQDEVPSRIPTHLAFWTEGDWLLDVW